MGSTLLLFITILIEVMRALAHIGKHILHTRIRTYQYCYRHLNENVSSFYSKKNTRESKGRNNAIQWLDKIVYARVDTECNVHMHELCKFNDALRHGLSKMNLNIRRCQKFRRKNGIK